MSAAVNAVPAATVETGILAGTRTLLYKEVLRFWKVSFQTVAAPVLTAVLYLLIFGHVLEGRVTVFGEVGYTSFLIPGLVMMSVLQNAFANSSSSLIQSKITGNLVFLLVSPLSHWAWFLAYVGASVVRGMVVGASIVSVDDCRVRLWHCGQLSYVLTHFGYRTVMWCPHEGHCERGTTRLYALANRVILSNRITTSFLCSTRRIARSKTSSATLM